MTTATNAANDAGTQKTATGSEIEVPMALWCKIDNVRAVSTVLSAIHRSGTSFDSSSCFNGSSCAPGTYCGDSNTTPHLAFVSVNDNGITFTVEEARCFQANCFLERSLFQEYSFVPTPPSLGPLQFRINLTVLLECLELLNSGVTSGGGSSSSVAMHMVMRAAGEQLNITLEEKPVTATCCVRAMEWGQGPTPMEFGKDAGQDGVELNEVIMVPELLKEAFSEFDWSASSLSSGVCRLLMSPDAPYFKISCEGTEVEYANDNGTFVRFRCRRTQVTKYRLAMLQPTVRALAIANNTKITVDRQGTLKFEHVVGTDDRNRGFVDFTICSCDQGDADADADDEAIQ